MVTDSPEALGDFLKSLSAANTPWEEHFQKIVCPDCEHYGKDCGKDCPNEGKRNNPTWWLNLGDKVWRDGGNDHPNQGGVPPGWGREYYTVDSTVKQVRAACICCDNTGKVTIKGDGVRMSALPWELEGQGDCQPENRVLRCQVEADEHNGHAARTGSVL